MLNLNVNVAADLGALKTEFDKLGGVIDKTMSAGATATAKLDTALDQATQSAQGAAHAQDAFGQKLIMVGGTIATVGGLVDRHLKPLLAFFGLELPPEVAKAINVTADFAKAVGAIGIVIGGFILSGAGAALITFFGTTVGAAIAATLGALALLGTALGVAYIAWQNFGVGVQDATQDLSDFHPVIRKTGDILLDVTKSTVTPFADAVASAQLEIDRLSDITRKDLVAALKSGSASLSEITKTLGLSDTAVRVLTASIKADEAAQKLWNAEARRTQAQLDAVENSAQMLARVMPKLTNDFVLQKGAILLNTVAVTGAIKSFQDLTGKIPLLHGPMGIARKDVNDLTAAYHQFGLKTPEELRKVADEAEAAFKRLRDSGTVSAADLQKAYEQMVEAVNVANGKIPSYWETEIVPRVKAAWTSIVDASADAFGKMLTGQMSFKDAMISIWDAIKSAIAAIIEDLVARALTTFVNWVARITGIIGGIPGGGSGAPPPPNLPPGYPGGPPGGPGGGYIIAPGEMAGFGMGLSGRPAAVSATSSRVVTLGGDTYHNTFMLPASAGANGDAFGDAAAKAFHARLQRDTKGFKSRLREQLA